MKLRQWRSLLLAAGLLGCLGCRGNQRQDTVLGWAENPSGTHRATILLRQYRVDGHFDDAPTTYVLLDEGSGKPNYDNGQEFADSQVVMKPARCGTLHVAWADDRALRVICVQCGLALTAAGSHASGMGAVRVEYEGFPERSSWEPGAH